MTVKLSTAQGRLLIHAPDHPSANNRGYVRYHRWLMEQWLDRRLEPYEHVHHIDEDKTNNSIWNLTVLTASQHATHHSSQPRLDYESIKRLRKSGLGYKKIAKELDYAISSVKSACRKMGI